MSAKARVNWDSVRRTEVEGRQDPFVEKNNAGRKRNPDSERD